MIDVVVVSRSELTIRGFADVVAPFGDVIGSVTGASPDEPATWGPADVVVWDLDTAGDHRTPGFELLVRRPQVRAVACLGRSVTNTMLREAGRAGVSTFVSPLMTGEELAAALHAAATGHSVGVRAVAAASIAGDDWPGRREGLSRRESEVLQLCADGRSNRQIADQLSLNLDTVKSHLKNVYRRLGLHGRADVLAFLGAAGSPGSPDAEFGGGRRSGTPPPTSSPELALDGGAAVEPGPESLERRLALLGQPDHGVPDSVRSQVSEQAAAFTSRLIELFAAMPATERFAADPSVVERLQRSQRDYLLALYGPPPDLDHTRRMFRVGAVHHRLRLAPQWFLATHARFVCDFVPVIYDAVGDPAEAARVVRTLVARAMFDAGLVLDAYELSVESSLLRPRPTTADADAARSATDVVAGAVGGRASPLVSLPRAADDRDQRSVLVGLGSADRRALADARPAVAAAMESVLDAFYEGIARQPDLASLLDGHDVQRLRDGVRRYWSEMVSADFDERPVGSLHRIGVVHERIGVSPQHYLVGLASQVVRLVDAVGTAPDQVVALVRAAFFDATYVIDAYLEARVNEMMRIGEFAEQVVARMESGLLILNARDRVEFANERFVDLVGLTATVLHRLPVDVALPIADIRSVLTPARAGVTTVATRQLGGRHVRLTAMRMEGLPRGRDLIGVVVEDISDVVLAGMLMAEDRRRLHHVAANVRAVLWEADAESTLLTLVSEPVERLIGRSATDLVGRATFLDLVPPGERAGLRTRWDSVEVGDDVEVDHHVVRADGTTVDVRTAMCAVEVLGGIRVVCGITTAR